MTDEQQAPTPRNWSSKPYRPRIGFEYEAMYQMRIVRKLSLEQIARKYKCDHTTVWYACVRMGIAAGSRRA